MNEYINGNDSLSDEILTFDELEQVDGSSSSFDPVKIYLKEMKASGPLTRSEEAETARQMEEGEKMALCAGLHLPDVMKRFLERASCLLKIAKELNFAPCRDIPVKEDDKEDFSHNQCEYVIGAIYKIYEENREILDAINNSNEIDITVIRAIRDGSIDKANIKANYTKIIENLNSLSGLLKDIRMEKRLFDGVVSDFKEEIERIKGWSETDLFCKTGL